MRRRRLLWPLLSAVVILCQLAQPLGLVPAAAGQPPQSLAGPAPIAASLPDTPAQVARPAWPKGPSVASVAAPALTPPRLPTPGAVAAPQGGPPPFPYGNNNFGQSYFDINNPDDHPGRHFAGPVNLINGNLFLTAGDDFFAARGLSVEFARSYNGQDSRNGPLGPGWTHTYNSAVITSTVITASVPGSVVVIRGGDGTLYPYTFNGAFWQPPAGYYRNLQHNSVADPFILHDKNGLVEMYDQSGRLRLTVDRNNNQLTYGYDLSGNLTNITDTSGVRSLILTYNPVSNTIQSLADPLGRLTTYYYDGTGRLSQVNYPEGSQATYIYDGSGRLMSYDDPHQPAGTITGTIQYNGNNQATHVQYRIDSFFDMFYPLPGPCPCNTTWTDSTGTQQRITYDPDYNVLLDQTFVSGFFEGDHWNYPAPLNLLPFSKTDANGNVTQYGYDALGNVTLVTDPIGATTLFRYEPTHNNVISTTNPLGHTTLYTYDGNGNLIHEIDPLGHELTYTVDLSGGNLLGTTDSAGRQTTYSYDGYGNLVGVIDPSGFVITHTYDAVGRVMQTVDPSGHATVYQYDNADRLVTLTDPLSGTLQYTYDSNSNLTRVVDPEGEIITHTYDSLDRLIRVTDALNHSTQYQYDGAGRLVLRTDATGATTSFGYDGASRLVQRSYSGGRQDIFTYDSGGRLTGMTDGTINTTIAYDRASRPVTLTLTAPGFTTGPTRSIYAYDAMGNRTGDVLQDSSGHTWQTNYQYDALGRLVRTTDNASRQWNTTYNAAGCRAQRALPDNSYEVYTYDPGCRLIQLDHFTAGNALIRHFVYTYDSRGNLLTERDGTQNSTYTYDALSRLATANTPEGLTTHTYGPSSERLTTSGPGGLNTTYHYDDAGHLTSLNDTTYQYDAMGRRISQSGPAGPRSFAYNGEMQLTHVADVFANVNLDYDPLGQLVHKQGGPGGNTYYLNGAGRVEAELSANGALSRTFTVDTEIVALNLISVSPVSLDYHFDGRGRVRWVTDAAGHTVAAYGTDPTADNNSNFYNPIRVMGSYYFPELKLYLIGDGQFWDPWSGTFIFRAWPWVFWPFGPFSAWHAIFRYWPWPWLWPRPWAWPWPRPWAWQWPWPGVWVRPWLIWPLWPWPVQPFWPWWWWWHWWGWPAWGHWWQWQWWGWWGWWWNWAWWGGWWWPWWWWPWWWWWPCWWMWWDWWGWWGWWWWWGWCWWCWGWWWWWWGWWPWWGGWGWWWVPWYWVPWLPRPPSHLLWLPLVRR